MRLRRSLAVAAVVVTLVTGTTLWSAVSASAATLSPASAAALNSTAPGRAQVYQSSWISDLIDAINEAMNQNAAAQKPSQVTGVEATAGDGRVDLTWDTPSSRRTITGYTVTYTAAGGATRTVNTSGRSVSLTGLTNGTTYSITVTASTSAGAGPASAVVTAVPFTVAAAPTALVATPGDKSFTAGWKAPSDNGGSAVTGYLLTYTTTGNVSGQTRTSGTSATVTGLQNGTTYRVSVVPVNAAGNGRSSGTTTVTPIAAAAPTTPAATPTVSAPAVPTTTPVTPTPEPTQTSTSPIVTNPTTAPVTSTPEPTQTSINPVVTPTTPATSAPEATTSPTTSAPATLTPTTGPVASSGSDLTTAGYNGYGQILTGSSDTTAHSSAVSVADTTLDPASISKISVGEYATCVVSNAKAYCWGGNPDGQIGDGTTTTRTAPVQVKGLLEGRTVTDIEAGIHQTCAVADGNAYCWGYNGKGQLGNGSTKNSLVPVAVSTSGVLAGKTVTSVSTVLNHTCALAEGQVSCWGENLWGQLGNGTTNDSSVPVAVSTAGVLKDKTVTRLSSGFVQNCVIADGKAYCWGYGAYGALGQNATTNSSVPVAVYAAADGLGGKTVTDIDTHSYSTCAVADGKAYCWGYNNYGPLGNDATNNRQYPIAVDASTGPLAGKTVVKVTTGYVESGPYSATGCAVTTDGTAACWGTTNTYGNLADGTAKGSMTPVAVNTVGALAGKAITQISTSGRTTSFLSR